MHELLTGGLVYTFIMKGVPDVKGKFIASSPSDGETWLRIQQEDRKHIIIRESDVSYAVAQDI